MGYSSVNAAEDVTSLSGEREYRWHFSRCVPETLEGQKLLIVSRSQLLDHAERKVQQRSQEKNEGLECNVREELVPGICPKPVATGLGLR